MTRHIDFVQPGIQQLDAERSANVGSSFVPDPSRRGLAIRLWTAQGIATIVAVVGALLELELIVYTGPALTLAGLALAGVTRAARSWQLLLFSLSAPLICAFCESLIAVFRWWPRDASAPVQKILILYAFAATPAFVVAYGHISKWGGSPALGQPIVWRFSLKSLFLVMTSVCGLLAVSQFILRDARGEHLIFGSYSLAVLGVVSAFLIDYVRSVHNAN